MVTSSLVLLVALGPLAPPHGLGLKVPTDAQYQRMMAKGVDFREFSKGLKSVPPPSVMLDRMPRPHPQGQGATNSCVGWSLGYAVTSFLEAEEASRDPVGDERVFSPSFIYSLRQNAEREPLMTLDDAVDILQQYGCASWADMPFSEQTAGDKPTLDQRMAAYPHRIAQYTVLPRPLRSDDIKQVLAQGLPVAVGVFVTPQFVELRGSNVYRGYRKADAQGGHAVCLVGYDDQRQAFRLLNSWGSGWADGGYAWVSYDLFDSPRNPTEAWCMAGVVVFDAPTLYVRSEARPLAGRRGRYEWSVWVEGGEEAMGKLTAMEYTLPLEYEPNIIRRYVTPDNPTGALHSSDLRPGDTGDSLLIQARFLMTSSVITPSQRPVLVACGGPAARPEVVRRQPERRGRYATGALIETDSQYDKAVGKGLDFAKFIKGLKAIPPESAELKYMPQPHEVGQGSAGSCVGWALAYAAKSCLEGEESGAVPQSEDGWFSPSFIYSQRPFQEEGLEGMFLSDAVDLLYQRGCVPWSVMPYAEDTASNPPTDAQRQAAYPYQIGQYMYVPRPVRSESIRMMIARNIPVVITARVTNAFMNLQGDAVFDTYDPEDFVGGHAMAVVAYDDHRQAFRLVNSWGREWADGGYAWVSYDLFDGPADDEAGFIKAAVGLVDMPNVDLVLNGSVAGGDWEVRLAASDDVLDKFFTVEYMMPPGFEPRQVLLPVKPDSPGVLTADKFTATPDEPSGEIWAMLHMGDDVIRPRARPLPLVAVTAGAAAARTGGGNSGSLNPSGFDVRRPAAAPPEDDRARELSALFGRLRSHRTPSAPSAASPRISLPRPGLSAPATASDTVAVPDLVGQSLSHASMAASRVGLKTRLASGSPAAALQMKIVSQDPRPGTAVAKGSTVTVRVQ